MNVATVAFGLLLLVAGTVSAAKQSQGDGLVDSLSFLVWLLNRGFARRTDRGGRPRASERGLPLLRWSSPVLSGMIRAIPLLYAPPRSCRNAADDYQRLKTTFEGLRVRTQAAVETAQDLRL